MPRKPDPDQSTGRRTCPKCNGLGTVWDPHTQANVVCGLCHGQMVVSQKAYAEYMALPPSAR